MRGRSRSRRAWRKRQIMEALLSLMFGTAWAAAFGLWLLKAAGAI